MLPPGQPGDALGDSSGGAVFVRMCSQPSEMMQRVGDEFGTQVNAVGLQGTMNAWLF